LGDEETLTRMNEAIVAELPLGDEALLLPSVGDPR
jgi:hypothetical protein